MLVRVRKPSPLLALRSPNLIQVIAALPVTCHFLRSRPERNGMAADRLVHIIDDDAAVRRALVRLLRSMGFTAMTYETAQAVLDDAATLSSGCILLDLQMPGMDGIELLGRLGGLGVDLPVIVVTGHGDVPTAVRAMKVMRAIARRISVLTIDIPPEDGSIPKRAITDNEKSRPE